MQVSRLVSMLNKELSPTNDLNLHELFGLDGAKILPSSIKKKHDG